MKLKYSRSHWNCIVYCALIKLYIYNSIRKYSVTKVGCTLGNEGGVKSQRRIREDPALVVGKVLDKDVTRSVQVPIHSESASRVGTGEKLGRSKVGVDLPARSARLASIGFVAKDDPATLVFPSRMEEPLTKPVVSPGKHVPRGLGSYVSFALLHHVGRIKFW